MQTSTPASAATLAGGSPLRSQEYASRPKRKPKEEISPCSWRTGSAVIGPPSPSTVTDRPGCNRCSVTIGGDSLSAGAPKQKPKRGRTALDGGSSQKTATPPPRGVKKPPRTACSWAVIG